MSKETKYTLGADIDLDEEVVLDRQGNRITEARAAEIAAETLEKAGRGRPPLARGQRGKSPEVKARVTPELRDRLVERAEREHKRPSTVVREALERYLDEAS